MSKKAELGIKKIMDDRILVQEDDAKDETSTGLKIPDGSKEKPTTGRVLMRGNGTEETDMAVEEGDHIMYGKYAGTEIEMNEVKCKIIRQEDVMMTLDDDDELGIGKLLADRILIKLDDSLNKTETGLVIPEEAQEEAVTGQVLKVGVGTKTKTMEVEEDDFILCNKYTGGEITVKGMKCKVIRHSEVVLVLDKVEK